MVHGLCGNLLEEALIADQYRSALVSDWPAILAEFVRKAVIDMWDRNAYMKRSLAAEVTAAAGGGGGGGGAVVDKGREAAAQSREMSDSNMTADGGIDM
jgi:hypothetical protein